MPKLRANPGGRLVRAIGYFRQTDEGGSGSIANQNRRFLDYCEAKGYEVATTFAEETRATSSAFIQMVDFLRQPEKGFLVVATQAPAILADSDVLAAARLLQVERLGARVEFIDSQGQPETDGLDVILQAWSDQDGGGMRNKVRSALRRKAVRGEVLGRPPYGYRVGANNRLEVVDEEAVVARYIFRLYLNDRLGIRLIARRLNEEGLRTRRNRPWSMVSIRDILRNRSYLGTYQRLGVRVPGTHPALVSPDDFRKVQERLVERRTNFTPKQVKGFLLSGLLTCGYCGNRLIGVSRKQFWTRQSDGSEKVASYRYYQCESRTNQGICSYHTRRAGDLESTVRDQLGGTEPGALASAGDDDAVIGQWQAEAERLNQRLRRIDRRLAHGLEDTSSGKLTKEELRQLGLDLAAERLSVEAELRDADWRVEHYASAVERRRTRNAALNMLVSEWDGLDLANHQQLLRELIDKIEVTDDEVRIGLRP